MASISAQCECGNDLDEAEVKLNDDIILVIGPCKDCLEVKYNKGYDDGSSDSYSEGYDEGAKENK